MRSLQTRRRLLVTLSSAAASGLIGRTKASAQEAPPETTTIRLAKNASICSAPQYIAGELLRADGFTNIEYVWRTPAVLSQAIGRRELDFAMHFSPPSILASACLPTKYHTLSTEGSTGIMSEL